MLLVLCLVLGNQGVSVAPHDGGEGEDLQGHIGVGLLAARIAAQGAVGGAHAAHEHSWHVAQGGEGDHAHHYAGEVRDLREELGVQQGD